MAIRYFCDSCGKEAREGGLAAVVISVPPQAETIDVCATCTAGITGELQRIREARHRMLVAPDRSLRALASALERYRETALDLPGIRSVAKMATYAAIFVVFFASVTLLTALR